ncbi:NUDIX hydrolase [Kitasatospora sp. NPDC050463]|uniref:NUDIX hydrolase n=1 Tax=Kitasatospora sp. NPDC050463 TaxID=3155786 RepID=UPI0033FFCC22
MLGTRPLICEVVPLRCYLLPYVWSQQDLTLVLGTKNIFGVRSGGKDGPDPIVWNNAAQRVIPGGASARGERPDAAAVREFREDTGIDLRDAETRERVRCEGHWWSHTFTADGAQFCCAFQRLQHERELIDEANANIQRRVAGIQDDELHDLASYAGARPEHHFGPGKLDTPWKRHQYDALDTRKRERFRELSGKPFDWFVLAAQYLRDHPGG